MIIVNCEQRSPEWYSSRCGVITASSCEDIFGRADRVQTYTYKLLAERLTGEADRFEKNEYMQWGIDTEDEARELYIVRTGNPVTQVGFIYKDHNKDVGCSPDGLINNDGLIEIKCPASKTHLKYLSEGPKDDYIKQMQFQMYVTGRAWCDFVSYDPRMPEAYKIYIQRIYRDNDFIAKIEANVQKVLANVSKFTIANVNRELANDA